MPPKNKGRPQKRVGIREHNFFFLGLSTVMCVTHFVMMPSFLDTPTSQLDVTLTWSGVQQVFYNVILWCHRY